MIYFACPVVDKRVKERKMEGEGRACWQEIRFEPSIDEDDTLCSWYLYAPIYHLLVTTTSVYELVEKKVDPGIKCVC